MNCYLIEDARGVTVVDSAHPRTWSVIEQALAAIGRERADVRALVLTHAHFDHLGFARRIADEWGVPIHGHPAELPLAARPYRYAHESPRWRYPLRYPAGALIIGRMAAAGALGVSGIDELRPLTAGAVLEVPGSPVVVATPGHTFGHCALHLPDRDAVLTGDALVTLDPYAGARGPRLVARAATADTETARASLAALGATGARTVLPGHGEPWRDGIATAVEAALAAPHP